MKAIMISKFGNADMLMEYEIPIPKITKNESLIRVISAGINPLDIKKRNGELKLFYGNKTPMGIGNDVYGEIVDICSNENFKKGDKVICMLDSGKNPNITGFSSGEGYAEYCITKISTLSKAPIIQNPEKLAAVPLATLTAMQAINKCVLGKMSSILINGASGGVGLFAVQIAIIKGIVVDTISNRKAFELLKGYGVRWQYDYRDDQHEYMNNKYDIIFDVACTMSIKQAKHLLNDRGIYISNVANIQLMLLSLFAPLKKILKNMKIYTYNWVKTNGLMLQEIAKYIESGEIKIEVSKAFKMNEASKAHEYFENNSIIGKVVLINT